MLGFLAKIWGGIKKAFASVTKVLPKIIRDYRRTSSLKSHFKDYFTGRISRHTLQVYLRSASTMDKLKFILQHPLKYRTYLRAIIGKYRDDTRFGITQRIEDKLGYLEQVERAKEEITSTTMTTPYKMPQEVEDLLNDVFKERTVAGMTKQQLNEIERQIDFELEKRGIELEDVTPEQVETKKEEDAKKEEAKPDEDKSYKRLPKKKENLKRDAAKGAYDHYLAQWKSNFFDSEVIDYYTGELMTEERKMEIMEQLEMSMDQFAFNKMDKFSARLNEIEEVITKEYPKKSKRKWNWRFWK